MKRALSIDEKWNTITHGIGFLLSVFGFVYILFLIRDKELLTSISLIVYTLSISTLYLASTLYHYAIDEKKKSFYRKLDHISIYLLIAGTYTPVTLIALINSKGILLFTIVWSLAIIGTVLKIFFTGKFEVISVMLYLLMGWAVVIDFESLKQSVSNGGLNYLFYGGAAYTLGIVFYAIEKIPFNHVIWHLFVLAGSIFHYYFIIKYIV